MAVPTKLSAARADRVLRRAQLHGFGGECGNVAIAINHVLFARKGRYVVATNPHFNARFKTFFMGHVVVEWRGKLFDSTGIVEDEEAIEAWGQFDDAVDWRLRLDALGVLADEDPLTEDQRYDGQLHYIDDVFAGQAEQERAIVALTAGRCPLQDLTATLKAALKATK